MNYFKKHSLWFLKVCLIMLNLLPVAVHAETQVIKLATLAPEGSTWMKVFQATKDEVEKNTDGRIKIVIYGSGVQGDEKVVVQKMRTGQLHGAALTSVGLSLIAPEIASMQLPLVFENYQQVDHTREAMRAEFEAKLLENGYVLLGWGDVGFSYIYSNQPIRKPSDLKKAKVWAWNSDPVTTRLITEAGANPIPLGVPDVLPALRTGQVNTVLVSPLVLVSLQWYPGMKYQMKQPLAFGIGALIVSKKQWDSFLPSDRDFINNATQKWTQILQDKIRKDNERALKLLKRHGIEELEASAEEMTAWKSTAIRTCDGLVGEAFPEETLDKLRQHANEVE